MQLALWGWLLLLVGVLATSVEGPYWLGLLLAKDGKQERAVVERAILERVIQFADLHESQGDRQSVGHTYMHRTRDAGRNPPLDSNQIDGVRRTFDLNKRRNNGFLWGRPATAICYSVLTRDGSNFSCLTSQKSSKSFSHRSRNSHGSSPQHHRCWFFSVSIVS